MSQGEVHARENAGEKRAHRRLFAVLFANFVLFGAGAIIIGAIVPKIIRQFGWSYLVMGAVLAAGSVGYFGSTFLCGILIHRWGPKKVIVCGLLLQSAGLVLFGIHPGVVVNLLAIALIGLGEGGTEVVTNYCTVRMEPPGQGRLMNLMHAAFTAGAIAGPLGIGLLLDRGMPWQVMFRCLAVLCVLVSGILLCLSFAGMQPGPRQTSSRAALVRLVRQPLLILLALIIFLYVGAEIGISNWIAEYYVQILGAADSTGARMVSVFWFGLLLGRLLLSAGYRGRRQAPLLFGLTCLATVSLIIALAGDTSWSAGAFFWITGLGFSAVYPIVVVLVGQHFQEEQGLAIGVVSTGGGIGSFLFPFVMSAIANRFGLTQGFWFYVAITAIMVVAAAGVLWLTRPRAALGKENLAP